MTMKKYKLIFFLFILFLGILLFFSGIFNSIFINNLILKGVLLESYNWSIIIGFFFILIGVFLLTPYKIKKIQNYKHVNFLRIV